MALAVPGCTAFVRIFRAALDLASRVTANEKAEGALGESGLCWLVLQWTRWVMPSGSASRTRWMEFISACSSGGTTCCNDAYLLFTLYNNVCNSCIICKCVYAYVVILLCVHIHREPSLCIVLIMKEFQLPGPVLVLLRCDFGQSA